MRAECGPAKDIRRPSVQTLRSGRQRAQAEDRKSYRVELAGVAVETPDHNAGQTDRFGLEQDDVADACFVQAASIVDDEDLAWLGFFKDLEKYVDASDMANRPRASRS